MINKDDLNRLIKMILIEEKEKFEGEDLFVVESKISADNRISVQIDSNAGVKISDCALLSKLIESKFDRENEDFELVVSSAGLDRPFRVIEQYHKNIGNIIKIVTTEGKRIKGKLITVTDNEIELEKENKKNENISNTLKYSNIKEAKVVITF